MKRLNPFDTRLGGLLSKSRLSSLVVPQETPPSGTAYDLYAWGGTNFALQGASQYTPVKIGADKDWYQLPSFSCSSTGNGAFAITTDGKLWAWGANTNGQLGLGHQTTPVASITQVGSDTDWKDCLIQNASNLSFALKNGKLYSCGVGTSGQLANGTTSGVVNTFTQVGTDDDWVWFAIGSGGGHAIKEDGTLWGWGDNGNYSLGLGTTGGSYSSPIQIGTDTDWAYVQRGALASSVHAIKTDGTLWAWGRNVSNCLGIDTDGASVQNPTKVNNDTDWAEIASVQGGTFFRKYDGTVWVMGESSNNDQLGLGDGVTTSSIIEHTALSNDNRKIGGHTYNGFALKTNGDMYSWGQMPAYAGQGSDTTNLFVPTLISGIDVEDFWNCTLGVLCLVKR